MNSFKDGLRRSGQSVLDARAQAVVDIPAYTPNSTSAGKENGTYTY